MKKYNLDSAKFFSLVVVIFTMFVFLVWNAFNYLPKNDDVIIYQDITPNQKDLLVEKESQEPALEQEEDDDEDISEELNEESLKSENQEEKFKIISDSEAENNELEISKKVKKEEEINELLNTIEVLKNNQNYNGAIAVCEKALQLTANNEIKANIQEEIANLHAKLKNYDLALSYAQKAYNYKQTAEREILLARLYYKTGDTNRAQVRMLNVLKREF